MEMGSAEMDGVWQERAIRSWFSMWLEGKAGDLTALFTPDVQYIESWGPEYRGVSQVRHWFQEWNTRGRVLVWELRSILHDGDRSVAEWYFKNTVDGRMEEFDGLSLIHWSGDGRIRRLQEFGCQRDRYDPYADGPDPKFQERPSLWF